MSRKSSALIDPIWAVDRGRSEFFNRIGWTRSFAVAGLNDRCSSHRPFNGPRPVGRCTSVTGHLAASGESRLTNDSLRSVWPAGHDPESTSIDFI